MFSTDTYTVYSDLFIYNHKREKKNELYRIVLPKFTSFFKGFFFCRKHYSFSLSYYDFLCYMCLLCCTGEIGSLRSVNASMMLYSVLFALLDEVKKNEMQNRGLFFSFLQLVVSYICILNNK